MSTFAVFQKFGQGVNGAALTVKQTIANYIDTPIDEISDEASFHDDFRLDSLALMEMVMAFEERFGVELDEQSTDALETVADAIAAVASKVLQVGAPHQAT
nr:acyl carrier protein [Rhizobium wenxiniae]